MNPFNTLGLMTADRTVQEGGKGVVYDLLGTNEQFKKTYILDLYVGVNNSQVVEIPYPAFAHVPVAPPGTVDETTSDISVSIVRMVHERGQVEELDLTYRATPAAFEAADEGWMIEEIDQNSMGKAHNLWNIPSGTDEWAFNGTIIKKIRVKDDSIDAHGGRLTLIISYRAFYKDAVETDTFRAETGPWYSRELGQHILDRLEALDLKTEVNLENMFGNTAASEDILEEDLTGVSEDNKVVAELHHVDTTTGHSLLAPAKGSFYPGEAPVDGPDTTLKLFLYHVEQGRVDATVIASGEKLGWLFIYTLNNLTEYSVCTDQYFLSHAKYYTTDQYGNYVLLTDYTPGDSIAEYRSTTHNEVFILKRIPFDPKKQLDGVINDSSAVITTTQSVVLTVDNIEKYENYYGTFVELEPSENGTRLLTLGVDYEFANVNQAKTERTYTRQPVYDHIRLLGSVTTDASHRIGITYQAFGGQVQPKDVRHIRQDLTNLLNILAKGQLLSYKGLGKHPIIKEIERRLARMEDYHHHYNRVDHVIPMRLVDVVVDPATGDTTSHVSDETDLQWYNIAQLYGDRWINGPNAKRDIGHFRISSREQGWTYEFIITVDLTGKGNNRMTVKVLGGTGVQYADVDDFVALTTKELVGLRLVWNGDGDTTGAILQVGIDYTKYNYVPTDPEHGTIQDTRDTDVITVTNKSGDTSSWELYYNPLDTSHAADAYIGVYGHSKYVQVINEIASSSINYYTPLKDYTYFGTTSELIRDGVDYFSYNAEGQTYESLDNLVVGTKVSDYKFAIYERSLYRTRWARSTRQDGDRITKDDNLYVVDGFTSSDKNSCTLPDGETTWSPSLANSKCIARILERDDGGTVVWVGTVPLAYFSFGPKDGIKTLQLHLSLTKVFQKYLDIEAIKAFDLTFYDRKEHRYFSKKVHTYIDDLDPSTHVRGEDIFFFEDMCGLTLNVGRIIVRMDVGDIFLAGVRYFYSEDGGEHFIEYEDPPIGRPVPAYELTSDLVFVDGKDYYKETGATFTKLLPGTNYTVGDSISAVSYPVYEVARTLYSEDDLIVASMDVALGNSSYINDRFDLRQVRMHL